MKIDSLKHKPIIYDSYKDWILEYHPTLGWVYFKKGDKICTVVYLEYKKDLIEFIDKNEQ